MRIALFTDGIFPYVIGGMQKHSHYLTKFLAKNGVDVDLYHFNCSEKNIDDLELFTEEEKKFIHPIVVPFPSSSRLPGHYLRDSYQYSQAVFEEFKKRAPVDLVYAKGFSGWRSIEEKKRGKFNVPIAVNFHGYEMFQKHFTIKSKLESYLLKGPVRYICKNADHVLSYGGNITSVIGAIGIERGKIIELSAAVDRSWIAKEIRPTLGKVHFIFIGRNERRKGLSELNRVLNKVKDTNDLSFEFIGPIPEDQKVISEKIKYHGEINDQEKIKMILKQNDVLVCPSLAEGMPNVILEAMACGSAVIASNVGAVSKMVDKNNGWLIPPGDVAALEQAILQVIQMEPKELDKKKQRSLDRVGLEFNWDKLIEKTIDEFKKMIA